MRRQKNDLWLVIATIVMIILFIEIIIRSGTIQIGCPAPILHKAA